MTEAASSFVAKGSPTSHDPSRSSDALEQDERKETLSGPIFGLTVSQGAERTCWSIHHHVARTANGFDISRRHCAQR